MDMFYNVIVEMFLNVIVDTFLNVIMDMFLSGKAGIMRPFLPANARPHHSDCGRAPSQAGGYKSGQFWRTALAFKVYMEYLLGSEIA